MQHAALLREASQHKQRFMSLEFQASRFRYARLLADFVARCRQRNFAIPHVDLPEFPLYSFGRTITGAFRIVHRDRIAGGGGGPSLHCWTEVVPEAIVLHAKGEVDVATAPLLAEAIAAAFHAGPRVIVDLSRLDYLDCAGIHVLEDAAQANGARFVVVGSKPQVRRMFEILELTDAKWAR